MASSGNFCVWNKETANGYGTVSKGNLEVKGNSNSGGQRALSSFGLTSGKWYMEFRITQAGNNYPRIGLSLGSAFDNANFSGDGHIAAVQYEAGTENNGSNVKNGNDSDGRGEFGTVTLTNTGVTGATSNQIIGFALDLDNRKLFISKDGTFFNSANPATGTNPQIAWDATPTDHIHIWGDAYQTATVLMANWGQDSTFHGTETATTNADGNGHGTFHSTVPTGYLAMCTANLPMSTNVDPAETDDDIPTKHFNSVAYTGTGTARTVSGFGFQPDMVWIKNRASPGDQAHRIVDSSRGVSKAMIAEDTQQENTETTAIQAFNSDGFTIGTALGGYNTNNGTYIAWGWRANGGTTSTNTSGTVTTTVQANQAAGFSILTYTGGNGSWGSTNQDTIGHGLSAAPEFMIFKERNNTDAWTVFHHLAIGTLSSAAHGNLRLDVADALYTNQSYKSFGGVMPTSTVITVEGNTTNSSTSNHIAYIWHGVDGYSKFGRYEGNGSTDGSYVFTGFRPRMIFCKQIDGAAEWTVYDSARSTTNMMSLVLQWDLSDAEKTSTDLSTDGVDFLSNGFKFRGGGGGRTNQSGRTFVYGAWGDVPFKYGNSHQQ